MIKNIKSEEEFQNVLDMMNNELMIVKFQASWCQPCKMLDIALSPLEDTTIILKIDVDALPEIASEFRVMSIPTMLFIKDKQVKNIFKGTTTTDKIVAMIDKINNVNGDEK